MRIAVRVVPRHLLAALYLAPAIEHDGHAAITFTFDDKAALIYPCVSYAQAAIDAFMAQLSSYDFACDIQDLDDPERGSLEPSYTGPLYGSEGFEGYAVDDRRMQ